MRICNGNALDEDGQHQAPVTGGNGPRCVIYPVGRILTNINMLRENC